MLDPDSGESSLLGNNLANQNLVLARFSFGSHSPTYTFSSDMTYLAHQRVTSFVEFVTCPTFDDVSQIMATFVNVV